MVAGYVHIAVKIGPLLTRPDVYIHWPQVWETINVAKGRLTKARVALDRVTNCRNTQRGPQRPSQKVLPRSFQVLVATTVSQGERFLAMQILSCNILSRKRAYAALSMFRKSHTPT
jgi:hypothetical protein